MTRTILCALRLLALGFLLLFPMLAWSGGEDLRFIVMGDCRPPGGSKDVIAPSAVYLQNIRETNLLDPDFVIIVGDLIMGYVSGDDEKVIREWDAFDKANELYEAPFRLVVGNHDVWDKPSEAIYQQRYGDLYYSFDAGGCHFIVLNSEDKTVVADDDTRTTDKIVGKQLEWLKKDLEAHKGKKTFVSLHKPLWHESYEESSNWNKDVHPLLAKYDVDTVFAGHWHIYMKSDVRDDVRYIITGGAGAEIGTNEATGAFYHYLMVTVRGEKTTIAVIKTGSVCSEDIVSEETIAQLEAFRRSQFTEPHGIDITDGVPEAVPFDLVLQNTFDAALSMKIEWDLSKTAWDVAGPKRQIQLAPGAKQTEAFTLVPPADADALFPPPVWVLSFEWPGTGGETRLPLSVLLTEKYIVKAPAHTPVIDGKADDWKGVKPLVIDKRWQLNGPGIKSAWNGPNDLSARLYLAYDGKYLYFLCDVEDDIFKNNSKAEEGPPYSGDSLILSLDSGNNAWDRTNPTYRTRDDDDFAYCFALSGGETIACTYDRKNRRADVTDPEFALKILPKPGSGGVIYEGRIPWRLAFKRGPTKGKVGHFTFKLNEDDTGAGREGVLTLTAPYNPSTWAELILD